MMGKAKYLQPKLFYREVNLNERIPPEHPLRRIKQLVDFGFVRQRVQGLYGYNGHESLDPALILKLMFLLFYENVRSERELMKRLGYQLDWLWFCDLDLDESPPDHSVLSKARRRWGLRVFEEVFAEVLRLCVEGGLVDAKTVYADSTLLKANASVGSRIPRVLWEQLEQGLQQEAGQQAGAEADGQDDSDRPGRTPAAPEDTQAGEVPDPPQGKFNAGTVSKTDPDSATCKRRGRGVTVGYLDHSLIDGKHGVVVATVATPGDDDDAGMLQPLLEKQKQYLHTQPRRVVGDSAYGTKANIESLRVQGIQAYLKRRASKTDRRGWLERMPEGCDPGVALAEMRRRLHTAEGRFAEAHVRYSHRRCRWRRRWRVQIQCYLVAAVQNIAKLLRYGRWPRRAGSRSAEVFGRILALAGDLRAALGRLRPKLATL